MNLPGRDRARAVVSHAEAQPGAYHQFVSAVPEPCSTDADISTLVFDDASMWVQDPSKDALAQPERFCLELMQRIKRSLGRRGKNCHLPVMNMSENVLSSRYLIRNWLL